MNTGSVPVSAALSGTGVTAAVLTASPAAVSFGSVLPGSQGGIRTIVVTNVGGSTTTLLSTALLGTDAGQFVFTSNSCAGMGLAPAQTCSVALQFVGGAPGSKSASLAVSAANAGSVTVPLAVTVIGWSHQDIGTVGAAGSWSLSGGTHTIRGAGADVWATADAFHYTFVSVTGNATITARVTAVENVHQWTKAMVMMRDGTAANASYMAALAPGLASNQYRQQFRETPGGPSSSNPGGTGAAGGWLRVVRVGGTFSTFFSIDGATWTPLGMPTSITMPSTILVGLGVTSHTLGTLATGTFDNVSVTQP